MIIWNNVTRTRVIGPTLIIDVTDLCLERDPMLEGLLGVKRYPGVVVVVLDEVVLLLGRHIAAGNTRHFTKFTQKTLLLLTNFINRTKRQHCTG